MKKLILLSLVFAFGLAACGEDKKIQGRYGCSGNTKEEVIACEKEEKGIYYRSEDTPSKNYAP